MINAILEVKATAEKELLYAQAKLEAVNEILEKVSPAEICDETITDEPEVVTDTVTTDDFTTI